MRRMEKPLVSLFLLTMCGVCVLGAKPVWAGQDNTEYPVRPVKLIVPFGPGGSTDLVARVLADRLREHLGQSVVVENRPGGGGALGTQAVVRAPADGYTLGMGTMSTLALNPLVSPSSARLDASREITPIITLVRIPSVYMVIPSVPVKNFPEFLQHMRQHPGRYVSGSAGAGTVGHVLIEAMNHAFGIELRHIPYKGMGQVVNAALNAEVQVYSDQYPSSAAHIKAGKLVAFAVGGKQRLTDLPAVPTLEELGYSDLNEMSITWLGLIAPPGTPEPIVQRLRQATQAVLDDSAMQARWKSMGLEPVGGTPEAFGALIQQTQARMLSVLKQRKMVVE